MDDPVTTGIAGTRSPILVDSLVLIAARVLYFALSRRYLLSHLSPTLRELQKTDPSLPQSTTLPRSSSLAAPTQPGSRARAASRASVLSVGGSIRTIRTPQEHPAPLPELDETEDSSPRSSYPGSPARPAITLEAFGGTSSPTPSLGRGPGAMEMQLLGSKLRDASARERSASVGSVASRGGSRVASGGRRASGRREDEGDGEGGPRVIQLAHSAPPPSAVGTRRVKRAARGLSRVARILFSVCFAESMTLITIVVLNALGVLHAHARRVNFSVSLHIILALVLLVVPLVQCLLCTYRSPRRDTVSTKTSSLSLPTRVAISLLPYTVYIFLFTRIPPYITATSFPSSTTGAGADANVAAEGWEGGGWLESSLGRVVVLGVVVIAGLSGIGAVVTAWDYLEQAAGTKRIVTDADVLQAERSLYRVRHDAQSKRDEIDRLSRNAPEQGNSWMGRVFGTKAEQETAALQTELRTLEIMESDISRSVTSLRARHKAQGFRATLKGTVYNVLGYVFAIYAVLRLLMCVASLLAPLATSAASPDPSTEKGNSNGDWISFVLALALTNLPFNAEDVDVASWSRTISLLFTGALVASSLTMVLRWLGRVLRLTSRTVGAGFMLLALGQLFATYVISLLVQLRSNLPPADPSQIPTFPDSDMTNSTMAATATDTTMAAAETGAEVEVASAAVAALGAVAAAAAHADDSLLRSLPDFRVFGRLFDAVFLLAAISTFIYRYVAAKFSDDTELYEALGR